MKGGQERLPEEGPSERRPEPQGEGTRLSLGSFPDPESKDIQLEFNDTGFPYIYLYCFLHFEIDAGFPSDSDSKESVCNEGDLGSIPGVGRSLGEGNGNPPVFLPGEFHGQRSLVDYSPLGPRESDMTEQLTLSLAIYNCDMLPLQILPGEKK